MNESRIEVSGTLEPTRSFGFWMVAGYLVLFLVRPWEELFPWLEPLRIERIYGVSMIVVVFLSGRGLQLSAQTTAVALMGLAVLISTFQAWDPAFAWPELYRYATVVVIYYVLRAICRRPSELYWLIVTYVFTMFGYLGKSLWEFFVYDKHLYAQNVKRLVGIELTYGEPNAVAMSAVLSLPLWFFLWLRREDLTAGIDGLFRWIYYGVVHSYPLIVLIAVGLTNSRAGMVGLAAFVMGAAFLFQRQMPLSRKVALALILMIVVWIAAPAEQKNRLRTLWNPDAGPSMAAASAGGRWEGFLAALKMIEERPVSGVGIGNFVPYRVANVDGVGLVAHNLPGQILGEIGWLGAVCFAFLVYTIWSDSRQLGRLGDEHPSLDTFWLLSRALQLTVLLLFLFGLSLHNGLRYNWLWLAAFGSLAVEFALAAADELDNEVGAAQPVDLFDDESTSTSANAFSEGFIN